MSYGMLICYSVFCSSPPWMEKGQHFTVPSLPYHLFGFLFTTIVRGAAPAVLIDRYIVFLFHNA